MFENVSKYINMLVATLLQNLGTEYSHGNNENGARQVNKILYKDIYLLRCPGPFTRNKLLWTSTYFQRLAFYSVNFEKIWYRN